MTIKTTAYLTALALSLTTLVVLPTVAHAQDSYGAEYAKTKKGGLLLDKMELKQSRPDAKGSFENAVAMNGHALVFQHDFNVCLVKMEPGAKAFTPAGVRWCVSQEAKAAYKNTRKVIFANGMLQCLDAAGKVVWASTPKKDPFAKIIIAPNGQLMITNAGGAVYWSKK